jgi:hypothetical protein
VRWSITRNLDGWTYIVVSIGIGFRDIDNPGNGPGQGVTAVMGRVRDIVKGGGGDIPDFTQIR